MLLGNNKFEVFWSTKWVRKHPVAPEKSSDPDRVEESTPLRRREQRVGGDSGPSTVLVQEECPSVSVSSCSLFRSQSESWPCDSEYGVDDRFLLVYRFGLLVYRIISVPVLRTHFP